MVVHASVIQQNVRERYPMGQSRCYVSLAGRLRSQHLTLQTWQRPGHFMGRPPAKHLCEATSRGNSMELRLTLASASLTLPSPCLAIWSNACDVRRKAGGEG